MNPTPPADILRSRRARLAEAVGGPVLLMGHEASARNFLANVYPFRQDSSFLYFVGCAEPGAAVVVGKGGHTTLYLPPQDPADELWHGKRPGRDALQAATGVDAVADRDRLEPRGYAALPVVEPFANADAAVLSDLPLDPEAPAEAGSGKLMAAIVEQRLQLDDWEVRAVRDAVAVTAVAHRQAMAATRPGLTEQAVHGLIAGVFAAHGCAAAYEPIVTVRGEILHGHAEARSLEVGQLLLVDAGAEHPSGYASDVTRTWPVSGRFEPRQRAVYDLVLAANEAAIAACTVGARYRDVHLLAARVLAQGLVDEGLLRGDVDGLVQRGAHAAFFPHGTGHLLGLDVHDMELFGDAAGYEPGRQRSRQFGLSYLRLDRDLLPGNVVTIEPGFYVVPAILADEALRAKLGDSVNWSEAEAWLGFGGVRIEDDVLVTEDGPEVLSEAIPKGAEEVEALVGSGPSAAERLGLG